MKDFDTKENGKDNYENSTGKKNWWWFQTKFINISLWGHGLAQKSISTV